MTIFVARSIQNVAHIFLNVPQFKQWQHDFVINAFHPIYISDNPENVQHIVYEKRIEIHDFEFDVALYFHPFCLSNYTIEPKIF